jgi:hypothetical protein
MARGAAVCRTCTGLELSCEAIIPESGASGRVVYNDASPGYEDLRASTGQLVRVRGAGAAA